VAKYHGKKGVVYISTSGSGNASSIQLTEWTLNMATDKVEVTSFGDANKTYVQGLKDTQGTINGFWDSADTKLFDAADSTDGIKMYLYPSSDASGLYFYGPAWLDASITTGVGSAVAMNGSFVANGSWGKKLS
jgi:hypothetical protein